MSLRSISPVLSAAALLLGALSGSAQIPGMVGRVDATDQQRTVERSANAPYQDGDSATELFPGEMSDVGPQSVLKIKTRKNYLEAVADSQYLYSDNVFLRRDHRQESGLLISTAQFAIAPKPYELWGGELAPRVGYRHQWFDFFQYQSHNPALNTEDFNAQTLFVDEYWRHGNWIVGAGFDYTRLLSTSSYDQFYAEYAPRWEAQRLFPLAQNHALSLSYLGCYHFTDARTAPLPEDSTADRIDQAFVAAYNFTPCSHVIIQPFYAFKYTHFTSEVHRDDYLQSFGLATYYFFNANFSARAFVGYDSKESSVAAAEYHQLGGGAGVNFTYRF